MWSCIVLPTFIFYSQIKIWRFHIKVETHLNQLKGLHTSNFSFLSSGYLLIFLLKKNVCFTGIILSSFISFEYLEDVQ